MYLDPLSIAPIATVTFGTAVNYDRIGDGLFLASTSTLDQPVQFSIQNTLDPNGTSSFVTKLTWAKNAPGSAPYGEKPQPDDVLQYHSVIRVPHRSFTNTEVNQARDIHTGFMYAAGYMAKLLSGQK